MGRTLVTARGPGCPQVSKIAKPLSACGMSLGASKNTVGVQLMEELYPSFLLQSSHNERGQRRRPTLNDCPSGWLLLKILPCSDSPDPSRNLCIPNFLVKLAHSTIHSYRQSILLQDLQELAALLGKEDWADPRLVMGKAEGPRKQGQFSH